MEHRKQVLVKANKQRTAITKKVKKIKNVPAKNAKAVKKSTKARFIQREEPSTSTASQNLRPVSSSNRLQRRTVSYKTITDDSDSDENSDGVCGSCGGVYNEGQDWICCDVCLKWRHRKCSGLSNPKKWNKYNREGVEFCCPDCE